MPTSYWSGSLCHSLFWAKISHVAWKKRLLLWDQRSCEPVAGFGATANAHNYQSQVVARGHPGATWVTMGEGVGEGRGGLLEGCWTTQVTLPVSRGEGDRGKKLRGVVNMERGNQLQIGFHLRHCYFCRCNTILLISIFDNDQYEEETCSHCTALSAKM